MDAADDVSKKGRVIQPVQIVTDWRRFACGLWRLPKGDIAAAYCADIFPKLKVFTHDGQLFMNGGNQFGHIIRTFAYCYPLIPFDEYCGPESVEYSYEGREGRYKGQSWRLGPETIFKSSDPTVEEWIRHLRVLYADGGHFVHGVTYRELLTNRLSPESPNEIIAHGQEVRLCESSSMPSTQEEMKLLLDGCPSISKPQPQLELAL